MSADTYRYNAFLNIYTDFLVERVKESPDDYAYPADQAPVVARKMVEAMKRGRANIKSAPIKRTCKAVGIKHTIGAIRQYLTELEQAEVPPMITTRQASKVVKDLLHRIGKSNKVTAKSVSFEGFGYGSKVFVTIHCWEAAECLARIQQTAKDHGFIVNTSWS